MDIIRSGHIQLKFEKWLDIYIDDIEIYFSEFSRTLRTHKGLFDLNKEIAIYRFAYLLYKYSYKGRPMY